MVIKFECILKLNPCISRTYFPIHVEIPHFTWFFFKIRDCVTEEGFSGDLGN